MAIKECDAKLISIKEIKYSTSLIRLTLKASLQSCVNGDYSVVTYMRYEKEGKMEGE